MSLHLKRCSKCVQCLPTDSFNKNAAARDGLQHCCRKCQVINNRLSSHKHPETRRLALKRDLQKHGRRPSKTCSLFMKRAHETVRRAINAGLLVRPGSCQKCGESERNIHAHHEDYLQPLIVTWVCPVCHAAIHLGAP